ncbi:hypothetical protein D9M70_579950 [compost metagenome]
MRVVVVSAALLDAADGATIGINVQCSVDDRAHHVIHGLILMNCHKPGLARVHPQVGDTVTVVDVPVQGIAVELGCFAVRWLHQLRIQVPIAAGDEESEVHLRETQLHKFLDHRRSAGLHNRLHKRGGH